MIDNMNIETYYTLNEHNNEHGQSINSTFSVRELFTCICIHYYAAWRTGLLYQYMTSQGTSETMADIRSKNAAIIKHSVK